MGAVLDFSLLLLCTALAAAWTRAWVGRRGGARWTAILLFAFGLFAFTFSATSPNDDPVQPVFATRAAKAGRQRSGAIRNPLSQSPFLARAVEPEHKPARPESSVVLAGDAAPSAFAIARPAIHSPPISR